MKLSKINPRSIYGILFVLLLAVEVFIALFVRDDFIRPYGGDVLVTILLCCLLRIFFPGKPRLLPLWVFLFAAAVEIGQYFHYVDLLGLGEIAFFRILMGTSFSVLDLICYAAGCVLFFIGEIVFKKRGGSSRIS